MPAQKPKQPTVPRIDVTGYEGQWLALHPRTSAIVSHHRLLSTASELAHANGIARPVMFYVSRSDAFFVGNSQ